MSRKSRKYSPELRAEVVKAVLETGNSPAKVAHDFGLLAETVRTWVRREGEIPGNTPDAQEAHDRARIAELERRVRELEDENSFLVKASAFFARNQK
ncbi:Transposase (plasmid) [Streptomyces sp. YIM 121038]|uniref:transposase n=1 Tax=Streptomyces sp. YIM 121038 TaxID=2136401 RepID=UPI0011105C6E|nr:transposase [Streptomyces sp. YIM 121038]QCX82313.1 Transposase [Streptomyces sp. YIM 121038]